MRIKKNVYQLLGNLYGSHQNVYAVVAGVLEMCENLDFTVSCVSMMATVEVGYERGKSCER